jgi:hypothetical protein
MLLAFQCHYGFISNANKQSKTRAEILVSKDSEQGHAVFQIS